MVTGLQDNPQRPFLSVIVPVFNEESAIVTFHDAICPALDGLGVSWEIVFVDDGSTDKTISRIRKVFEKIRAIRVVRFSRNFGKDNALTAGFDHADGQVVCPIDADLQHPPELIGEMIDRWRDGYDVVIAARSSRESDTWPKRMAAKLFYAVLNRLSNNEIRPDTTDFGLIDRRVVDVISALPERSRFMRALISWPGFKTTFVEFRAGDRSHGRSRYSYWTLWNYGLDGLTAVSTIPLRLWSYVGAAVGLSGLVYAAWLAVRTLLFGIDVPGYASTIGAVLILGGVQLLSLGIIGEYVGRMFIETKRRPRYIVDEIIDLSEGTSPPAERRSW